MIIDTILTIIGAVFVIWFYYDTKEDLKRFDESPAPELMPEIIRRDKPPEAIQAPPQEQPQKIEPFRPIPTEPNETAKQINRAQLERIARNCLCASGCTFNTWVYCKDKTDIELMDIIKDYNLNN